MTTSARMADVIGRLFTDGVSARDATAYFTDTYHDDVVIHESPALPYGGAYAGIEGVKRHAQAFLHTWGRFQDPAHRDLGARVSYGQDEALVRWELRVRDGDGDGDGDISFPAVSVYRFAEDLIIESRMFHFSDAALLKFLERAVPTV